jgi:hypothetical protein
VARSSKGTKTRALRASKGHYAGIGATGPSFRLAATHFVRWLRPMNHIDLANFRVDCLASRETEYGQYGRKGL